MLLFQAATIFLLAGVTTAVPDAQRGRLRGKIRTSISEIKVNKHFYSTHFRSSLNNKRGVGKSDLP